MGQWVARRWGFTRSPSEFPMIVERLRGAPVRAAELVKGVKAHRLRARPSPKEWSAIEHIGHLNDLAPLDEQRLEEYLSGAAILSAADPTNRATEAAEHRRLAVGDVLFRFRAGREPFVRALAGLPEDQVSLTAEHPRLHQAMRLLDWAEFVAEHDDHHLTKARSLIGSPAAPGHEDPVLDLNQLSLAVADVPRSVRFYTALGLTQIVDTQGYARFECYPEGPSLSVYASSDPPRSSTTIYFEVPNLQGAVAALRARGIEINREPVEQPWLWHEVVLTDPDGYPICLYHAGSHRLYPPWRMDEA